MYLEIISSLLLTIFICSICLCADQMQTHEVILTTLDNVNIHATHLSYGKDNILIFCHRLLGSGSDFEQLSIKDAFLHDFDILSMDLRGHRQSGLASTCGGDEVLDLHAAIEYAKKLDIKRSY